MSRTRPFTVPRVVALPLGVVLLLELTLLGPVLATDEEVSPFSSGGGGSEGKTEPTALPYDQLPVDAETAKIYGDVLTKLDPLSVGNNDYIASLESLSEVLARRHYFEQAEKILQRAEKLSQSQFASDGSRIRIQLALASLFTRQKKYKEALPYAKKSFDLADNCWDPLYQDPELHVATLTKLASVLTELNRCGEAQQHLEAALEFTEENRNTFPNKMSYWATKVDVNTLLAKCLDKKDDVRAATKTWLTVIKDSRYLDKPPSYTHASIAVQAYAWFLRNHEQGEKATMIEKKFFSHHYFVQKHFQRDPFDSYQIRKHREAEERARKNRIPGPPTDPAKKQEANAGSLI